MHFYDLMVETHFVPILVSRAIVVQDDRQGVLSVRIPVVWQCHRETIGVILKCRVPVCVVHKLRVDQSLATVCTFFRRN